MIVTLTSVDFDPLAVLAVDALPGSEMKTITRRVNRVPTLDLGVAINDRGFSHGDRTFRLRWLSTRATIDTAAYITRTHSRVRVANDEGVFDALIQDFTPDARESLITLLIIERLT